MTGQKSIIVSILDGPTQIFTWLAPAVADWRLIFKKAARIEHQRLRQAWLDRWPALETAYVAELGWTETRLLESRHHALADGVASFQIAIRKTIAWDVWYVVSYLVSASIAAIFVGFISLVSLVGYVCAAALLVWVGYGLRRRGLLLEVAIVAGVSALIIVGAIRFGGPHEAPTVARDLRFGLIPGASLWGSILILIRLIYAKIAAYEARAQARKLPIEAIVAELSTVIDWLSEPFEEFLEQDRRKRSSAALVRCSYAIKAGLIRFLEPPSPAVRALVAAHLERAADTLHSYACWVLVPDQTTRDGVRLRCLTTFAAVELREFGLLPDDSPAGLTRSETLKLVLGYARRLLLVLVAPAVVYSARQMGYLSDKALYSNAILFATLWTAVNLGYLLDSQTGAKMTAVKDAATMLHPTAPVGAKK